MNKSPCEEIGHLGFIKKGVFTCYRCTYSERAGGRLPCEHAKLINALQDCIDRGWGNHIIKVMEVYPYTCDECGAKLGTEIKDKLKLEKEPSLDRDIDIFIHGLRFLKDICEEGGKGSDKQQSQIAVERVIEALRLQEKELMEESSKVNIFRDYEIKSRDIPFIRGLIEKLEELNK